LTAARQRALLLGADLTALALVLIVWAPASLAVGIAALGLLVSVRWVRGLYVARFSLSALDEFPRALGAGLIAGGILGAFAAVPAIPVQAIDVAWVSGCAVLLALLRVPVYVVLRILRRKEVARQRLLLVGGGVIADAISELADGNADYGLDLVGRAPDLVNTDLVAAADEAGATIVLLAFSRASEAREVFEIRRGLAAGLRIMAVPRYFDLINDTRADDVLFGVPVQGLGGKRGVVTPWIKRLFDIALSALGLALVAPFMLVMMPLLKRETGGDLLFKQVRVGKDGESFRLLKLQTMKPVAEATSNTTWTVTANSARLGPIGTFLRKTSLDEVPQLWNILRGEMSFVGPRPERPHFVEQFSQRYPHYGDRHRMPAGLTGLAQIYDLRGDTSIDDRARFDNRYADHWSLWWDIKIMLKTVPKVFKGAGG
jgi:exopolysaccharide biosynthesis polyprenyl glycosylphosphotransferase